MENLDEIIEFKSSPALVEAMYKYGTTKRYKTGEIIFNEKSCIRSIPIITKGILKVIRTEEDGREILLYYIKAGESCIMSFMGGLLNETSKVKAEVEEDAEILFLPIEKAALFNKEYPEWLTYIFRLYHKRFEELLDMVNSTAFKK